MKYKIVGLSKQDAFYDTRKEMIGRTGELADTIKPISYGGGWQTCALKLELTPNKYTDITFYKVRITKVKGQ
jgi:hypothetical protein